MERLSRKIDLFLLEWKQNAERMPLIVKGARQIGKTEAIEFFAKNHYTSIVEINFVLQKQYKSIYVSEGDTLWNIAKENQITNQYYKDKDVRYIINDLMEINNLSNSNIRINQEILIPIV